MTKSFYITICGVAVAALVVILAWRWVKSREVEEGAVAPIQWNTGPATAPSVDTPAQAPSESVAAPTTQAVPNQTVPPISVSPTPATVFFKTAEGKAVLSVPTGSVGPEQAREVDGTYRMYMAHAPLRTPSVSDPDSSENRKILEQMVLKGLSQNSQKVQSP